MMMNLIKLALVIIIFIICFLLTNCNRNELIIHAEPDLQYKKKEQVGIFFS
jgi:hypothetical protein